MLDFKVGLQWQYKDKKGDFTLFHRPFLLALKDWRPAFELIAQDVLERRVVRQFETEGAAETTGWKELAPSTVKQRGSAHPILRISGAMFRSFRKGETDHVQEVSEQRLVWGSQNPYALFHEFGTGKRVSFKAAGARRVIRKSKTETREPESQGIPARPMLVYSRAMGDEISAIMFARLELVARQVGYARFGRHIEGPAEARKIGEQILGER